MNLITYFVLVAITYIALSSAFKDDKCYDDKEESL